MENVIKNLKNNKSPGWDGLTAEFYRHFWEDIKQTLYQSYLESINHHCLSPSQRIGIINLIPKPKPPPDLAYLKNWRPITMPNVDYKIFTHIIKNRICDALPSVISKVQSGFQSGKSTQDNIVLMCLVLEHFNREEDDGALLLQVDFEKAFDSVDHQFLFKTMEKMGFGPYLVKLVKIALNGCMSFLNINGHLSTQVVLGRGLHQGSPLSPILFLLIAQVFTSKIECNLNIKGINVDGIDLLLSLFADDSDLFLEATGICLDEVIKELANFARVSGCKYNLDKKCIPLGKAKQDISLMSNIKSTYGDKFIINEFIALGVDFDNFNNIQVISNNSYLDKLERARSRSKFWETRDLTIYGRITLIKSLLMSQFVYIATSMLRPSNKIISDTTKFMFNFLWGVKCDKIKRDIVVQKRENGGLNMLYPKDFFQSMKLKLVEKIGDIKFEHKWKDIILNQVKLPEHPGICFENGLVEMKYAFTNDLIQCYNEWKETSAKVKNKCINHCIWFNNSFKDIGSKLWVPSLINNNVNYLSEFVKKDGEVMTYEEFCTETLDRCWHIISKREYVDIKMAIRSFSSNNIPQRNLNNIDLKLNLSFFTDLGPRKLKATVIRDAIHGKVNITDILPLQNWNRDLGIDYLDWRKIFRNTYIFCKNLKIIQFQYKLFMRISTSRYMRYKMKIDTVSPNCIYCESQIETLYHIFLECPKTVSLFRNIQIRITDNMISDYRDDNLVFYITCSHENQAINYIWAAFKYYISRCFQTHKEPSIRGFEMYIGKILNGENDFTTRSVKEGLNLVD